MFIKNATMDHVYLKRINPLGGNMHYGERGWLRQMSNSLIFKNIRHGH